MTPTQRKAMQQALADMVSFESGTCGLYRGEFAESITALRAALAEQPAEPVAWMWEVQEGSPIMKRKGEKHGVYFENPSEIGIDIYSEDQQKNYRWTLLYTAPQPAKRVPLTDEEIAALWLSSISGPLTATKFARAIERAHGIGEKT